ncbi:two-component system, OmpR family, sensor histidine kinase PhoQ [Gammaproteobacteria bacterium]
MRLMRMMRSIVGSLTLGLALSLALVFTIQFFASRVAVETMLKNFVIDGLKQDTEELSGSLIIGADGTFHFAIIHYDPVYLQTGSGRYFQVFAGDGQTLRSPSLGDLSLEFPATAPGQSSLGRVGSQQLLQFSDGYERSGHRFTIVVAADIRPITDQMERFLTHYTELTVVMFAILLLFQIGIVRRALAPLHHAQSDVTRLERGEISKIGEGVPTEVLPLVRSINQLLGLLVERLRRSRESLGNLSHALKSPLTLLTQLSEHESIRAEPALRAQILDQLRIVGDRIERELQRARVAGRILAGPKLDLAGEINLLVVTMHKLYHDRHLDIVATTSPHAIFQGDREDFLELCGNLFDNACKWANHKVHITVLDDSGFLLTVEDDGPGCTEADLIRIAERGVRLDESTAGHGLGLAIVRNIVSSCGGELRFDRSADLGGLFVAVSLPDRFLLHHLVPPD